MDQGTFKSFVDRVLADGERGVDLRTTGRVNRRCAWRGLVRSYVYLYITKQWCSLRSFFSSFAVSKPLSSSFNFYT